VPYWPILADKSRVVACSAADFPNFMTFFKFSQIFRSRSGGTINNRSVWT
jgi:hypothetical protein